MTLFFFPVDDSSNCFINILRAGTVERHKPATSDKARTRPRKREKGHRERNLTRLGEKRERFKQGDCITISIGSH